DTHKVRNLMHGFINARMSANDLAAISIMGGARSQSFTRNRQLLHDAVDRFIGDKDDGPEVAIGETFGEIGELRRQQALSAITRMAEWLGSIKGRRKALVLITSSSLCSLSSNECREPLQQALRATMQADVSIYVVDPKGLTASDRSPAENSNPNSRYVDGGYSEASNEEAARAAFADMKAQSRGPADGARYLAEESGGIAVVNTNDLQRGLDRIVRDASSYYLLGYHSTNNRTDGRFRRNQVAVSRKDVRVVHRNGYFAARQARPADAQLATGGSTIAAQLRELARSPLPVSAMPLRVAATPFLSAENKARVAVVVEMPPQGLRPATEDGRYRLHIGLQIGFYDRSGKPVAGDDPTMDLDIPLNAAPKVTPNGVRMVSRIAVPPGAYRVWVGATQTPSGMGGSVMTEIDIPDFDSQPLALSGIAVSSTEARRIFTARTDALLDDVFGGPPVAHREFNMDSDVWLYGEIYDHRSSGGDVTANVIVKSAGGDVVYQTPFEAAPVQFGHLARIPLKEIGAGSFVATIEVRSSTP
ncbi:MAG: VWA domain-containing protein, partial [Acidobacteria bacterium]